MLVIFVTAIVLSTDTTRNAISCQHITSILLWSSISAAIPNKPFDFLKIHILVVMSQQLRQLHTVQTHASH